MSFESALNGLCLHILDFNHLLGGNKVVFKSSPNHLLHTLDLRLLIIYIFSKGKNMSLNLGICSVKSRVGGHSLKHAKF